MQAVCSKLNLGGKSQALEGSWKAGLREDASWQDIVREMESSFWSKPQVLAELEEGATELKGAIAAYKAICAEVELAQDEQLTKKANGPFRRRT